MNLLSKVVSKYRSTPQQVKASFWFVICGFLQRAISLLTTPIFSRFLTTSEYGIFSVYHTWQDIIIIFASLNLALGVYLRGLIKYEDDQEEFTESLQSLYLINFFIVFGIYLLFHKSWNIIFELPTVYVCLMFADMMFQVSFQFWSARQRVKFYYKSLVSLTIFHSIVTPICSIIAVTYGKNRVSARICVSVLTDVVFFGPLFVKMFWHKDKIISRKYWKYALAYNLPLIPHYLSQILLNQSDRVMINNMVGASKAGIYSLAYSAAAILTIVNQSILNSYNPWMYQKYETVNIKI